MFNIPINPMNITYDMVLSCFIIVYHVLSPRSALTWIIWIMNLHKISALPAEAHCSADCTAHMVHLGDWLEQHLMGFTSFFGGNHPQEWERLGMYVGEKAYHRCPLCFVGAKKSCTTGQFHHASEGFFFQNLMWHHRSLQAEPFPTTDTWIWCRRILDPMTLVMAVIGIGLSECDATGTDRSPGRFTTTNLSYRVPILKLPPPPCAVVDNKISPSFCISDFIDNM